MNTQNIGIIYNEPVTSGDFKESSMDVLVQVDAIEKSLIELDIKPVRIPFTRDIKKFIQAIENEKITMVFNLCETVDEDPNFAGHPAALLELLNIPFTGSPSISLMLTTDKLLTKRLITAGGMTTPDFIVYNAVDPLHFGNLKFPVIIKPRFQEASIGIDQDSICKNEKELNKKAGEFYERFGLIIIEEFIEGREFNLSLCGFPSPKLLPVAEIDFSAFPENLYQIVGYKAKWDSNSFEYNNTPRKFPDDLTRVLLTKMEIIAQICFRNFMLRDYARIDMRVDKRGEINILEINANPCLSPDAGFYGALEKSNVSYTQMVAEFISFMQKRVKK